MSKNIYYVCLVIEFLIVAGVAMIGWILGEITQWWSITIFLTIVAGAATLKDVTELTNELLKTLEED